MPFVSKLFLWKKRTLYLGEYSQPIRFVQPASSIGFSLGEPFKFQIDADTTLETRSFLLRPGQAVSGPPQDSPIAFCMLDPMGVDYAALAPQMTQQVADIRYDIENEDHYISRFQTLYQEDLNESECYQQLCDILHNKSTPPPSYDKRVERVIELIQSQVADNVSADDLAKAVGISTPHLLQLFRDQVGAPIRRYRLWHRLFCATQEIARTKNLTQGALAAGFSDTAHFNRTFRRMLGLTPTHLLAQPNGLKIYIEEQEPTTLV